MMDFKKITIISLLGISLFTGSLFAQDAKKEADLTVPAKATDSDKEAVNPITLNQYFSNDVPFRGFSVLGDRLARRDNRQYQSMQHGWNLVTGVSFNPLENLSLGMNVYSPTAHRTNRDSDYFMQSAPGDRNDFTQTYIDSAIANNPNNLISAGIKKNVDPSSIQFRKERNGLKDIFDASLRYKYNTRFGKVITGFYMANNDNFSPITLGEFVTGLEFPFLKELNPTYTAFFRFTSEGGGGGNGTSNHRLSISHKFFEESDINFTTALSAGYQYHSNQSDFRSGVSDVSPKFQVNYKDFYINFWDQIRPDSRVYDTPGGSLGVYKDTNRADGKVDDPSKVNGSYNKMVVEQIGSFVDRFRATDTTGGYVNDAFKVAMTQHYQQQKFVHHIYFFTIGYSVKF